MTFVLIIGGTSGIGMALASKRALQGDQVILTGRDAGKARAVAAEISRTLGATYPAPLGIAVDLSKPQSLEASLSGITQVNHIVLAGMARDQNSVEHYNIDSAIDMATTKIVGYTAVLHVLRQRIAPEGSVLLFGGGARRVPYPGSTTVAAVNSAVLGMVTTLSRELAPIRVNAIHPGLVADTPFWSGKDAVQEATRLRTSSRRLPLTADIVDACEFLMRNPAANGVQLDIDGGLV